jgi:uncharacterized protein YydD (DUF2326 family)
VIRGIRANKPGFRHVKFRAGANLLLADRSQTAGDKDTTNALGKSTLLEIIDFCLGAQANADQGLRIEPLQEWTFTLDLTLRGADVSVTRAVSTPNFFEIEGDTSGWIVAPEKNKEGTPGLDLKSWRSVLAWALFGLPASTDGQKYWPSARSLLSYFVRSGPAAYNSPFKHFENQKVWDVQVHNAFLLGLDWDKARAWQQLKDQKNALDALDRAIKTGAIDGELTSLGELEAERIALELQLARGAEALQSFQVLPQYREIETEANRLTAEIHSLVNANVVDKRRIDRYRSIADEEAPHDVGRLEALYGEAGVVLPTAVSRTLEEARAFNAAIVRNRQDFIAKELTALEVAVQHREIQIAELTKTRATYLNALSGHGALEEFVRLQELHANTRHKLDTLTARINQVRQMTTKSDQIKVETVELKRAAENDYEERRELWTKALALFSDFSKHLYKLPGRLVIDIDDTGYRFNIEIDGDQSEGISKMKIFCYDLMLISFARMRGMGIDFLVHDSTIFDGVDPRQRAHAIELATSVSRQYGFQYLCTLNTDMVPYGDFTENFDPEDLVSMRLTDTDPSGSLLGFRY